MPIDGKGKTDYDENKFILFSAREEPGARMENARGKGELQMYTQEITVNNEVGLHARPATFFIQKANEFKSGIWLEKDERRVNAKSLLGVLSLGIVKGTTITLLADGADEKEAVTALCELVSNNFGE